MKVIIAGGRGFQDAQLLLRAISSSRFPITEVVSGGAAGADALGEEWAAQHHVPVKRFPADWRKYGRGAGPARNREMALYADACICLWDGRSPGTKNMIAEARRSGLPVFVQYTDGKTEAIQPAAR